MCERALMGSAQHHARRLAGCMSLLPARRAQTPAVAGFEAGKAEFRHRRRQVVAACLGKIEECRSHHDTDGVAAEILRPGVTAAVAVKPGHRRDRASFELLAQNIAWRTPPATAIALIIGEHDRP